jgi:uncharacterized protein (TIGR02145 family)
LVNYVGGQSNAGDKLKEAGTSHWNAPNLGANNSTGFTAIPGGYRYTQGLFFNLGQTGTWWTTSENSTTNAKNLSMDYDYNSIFHGGYGKSCGFSVRCLRD